MVKTCLDSLGNKRGKIKGTTISVYKKTGEVGTLHYKLTKDLSIMGLLAYAVGWL